MIQGVLDSKNLLVLPEEGAMDDLRLALSFHPYYTYEAWHVAKEIPEATLLAAEKDILAGRVRKLGDLKGQSLLIE